MHQGSSFIPKAGLSSTRARCSQPSAAAGNAQPRAQAAAVVVRVAAMHGERSCFVALLSNAAWPSCRGRRHHSSDHTRNLETCKEQCGISAVLAGILPAGKLTASKQGAVSRRELGGEGGKCPPLYCCRGYRSPFIPNRDHRDQGSGKALARSGASRACAGPAPPPARSRWSK